MWITSCFWLRREKPYACQDAVPHARTSLIVHGWGDDVVPPNNSISFARQHGCALHLLAGDHRLNAALPAIEPLFGLFLQGILDTPAVCTA